MADTVIRIIIEGDDRASDDLDKVAKSSTSLSKELKTIGKGAVVVTASLVALGAAGKAAFEFGAEGAAITQTGESFDFLIQKMGAAPDLFMQLQDAADGTISKMGLMSSTATLLAGASGELGTELANSTPRLLEIARAANKLNPSLGSTTFLFDSLALGIKRASPFILDNLGLQISLGKANETLAKSLGKTVDALTKEEKQIALLNEVMRQGDTLIGQVGGSVDSLTDDYSRLFVAVQEMMNATKEGVGEALRPAAVAITDTITEANLLRSALDSGAIAAIGFGLFIDKATGETIRHAEALEVAERAYEELQAAAGAAGDAIDEAIPEDADIVATVTFETATTGAQAVAQIQSLFDQAEFELNKDAVKIAEDINIINQLVAAEEITAAEAFPFIEELKAELEAALSEEGLAGLTIVPPTLSAEDVGRVEELVGLRSETAVALGKEKISQEELNDLLRDQKEIQIEINELLAGTGEPIGETPFAGLTDTQFSQLKGNFEDQMISPLKEVKALIGPEEGVIADLELLKELKLNVVGTQINSFVKKPLLSSSQIASNLSSVLDELNGREIEIFVNIIQTGDLPQVEPP